jgi:hypothetical protein
MANPRLAYRAATALVAVTVSVPLGAGDALLVTQPLGLRPTVDESVAAVADTALGMGFTPWILEADAFTDLGDLGRFDCVWDFRVDDLPGPLQETSLGDYARAGGTLYLAGEHGFFDFRNAWIASFLAGLGAGPVLTDVLPPASPVAVDLPEAIDPSHPLAFECEPVAEVMFNGIDNGNFLAVGSGRALTRAGTEVGSAVWDPGTLALAPEASAVVALDINWTAPFPSGTLDLRNDGVTATDNLPFLRNLVTYLCDTNSPRRPRSAGSPRSPLTPCSPRSPVSPGSALGGLPAI